MTALEPTLSKIRELQKPTAGRRKAAERSDWFRSEIFAKIGSDLVV